MNVCRLRSLKISSYLNVFSSLCSSTRLLSETILIKLAVLSTSAADVLIEDTVCSRSLDNFYTVKMKIGKDFLDIQYDILKTYIIS